MLLIMNNIDEPVKFIDDDSGRRINIPIAMISKQDGGVLFDGYLVKKNATLADYIWATVNFKLNKTIKNG